MSERTKSMAGPHPRCLVALDDVHVRYRVRQQSSRSGLLAFGRRGTKREVHAVRGVTLRVRAGERLGVIGRNGSGKSSLLRVMAGLLTASSGQARASSYPVLLGISAALNAQLTGRQNVLLGCTALGMSRRQALQESESIIRFAGVEDFADIPMRAYSAGMRARLHFAIATVVRPEVLLIDEALGAGDVHFKDRSRQRIEELTSSSGAVVLVSHNNAQIRSLCERLVWMDAGQVVCDGDVGSVLDQYEGSEVREEASGES